MEICLNQSFLDWFASKDRSDYLMFEFGSGHSTPWFAARVRHLVTADHDMDWLELATNLCDEQGVNNEDVVSLIANDENSLPDLIRRGTMYNFILIDGRNRVACVNIADFFVRIDGYIALDDSQRPKYAKAVSRLTRSYGAPMVFDAPGHEREISVWWNNPDGL